MSDVWALMRATRILLLLPGVLCVIGIVLYFAWGHDERTKEDIMKTQLPHPVLDGRMSFEKALSLRRSIRAYLPAPLSLAEISQILWAAQGITGEGKLRAAPSAGALYPILIYLVVEKVESLQPGIYRYSPENHEITRLKDGTFLKQLADAALGQSCVETCAAALIIAANYERLRYRYRERSERYAHIEAGHVAQNVYLQAETIGLATVNIGAFYDNEVSKVVGLDSKEIPLCIMPLGKKK